MHFSYLRFDDECLRHKILDLIGDLAILGRPIQGHILASKAGHGLDIALARNIMQAETQDELLVKRGASKVRTISNHIIEEKIKAAK